MLIFNEDTRPSFIDLAKTIAKKQLGSSAQVSASNNAFYED
jgi:hypothetical protein